MVVTVGTFGGFNTTICAALSPALVHEPIVQVAEYVVVAVEITVCVAPVTPLLQVIVPPGQFDAERLIDVPAQTV